MFVRACGQRPIFGLTAPSRKLEIFDPLNLPECLNSVFVEVGEGPHWGRDYAPPLTSLWLRPKRRVRQNKADFLSSASVRGGVCEVPMEEFIPKTPRPGAPTFYRLPRNTVIHVTELLSV
jgi:hypothetical protein